MTISDKAAMMALSILKSEGKDGWGIKIFIAGQGCSGPSYGLNIQEKQMPGDEVIEKNGLKVFVDKETLMTLAGRELDYYSGEHGEGFIFTGGVSACSSGCDSCG